MYAASNDGGRKKRKLSLNPSLQSTKEERKEEHEKGAAKGLFCALSITFQTATYMS
jgi:hypothetical protein